MIGKAEIRSRTAPIGSNVTVSTAFLGFAPSVPWKLGRQTKLYFAITTSMVSSFLWGLSSSVSTGLTVTGVSREAGW